MCVHGRRAIVLFGFSSTGSAASILSDIHIPSGHCVPPSQHVPAVVVGAERKPTVRCMLPRRYAEVNFCVQVKRLP